MESGTVRIDELVVDAVAGDAQARDRLLATIHVTVLRYCRGRLGRGETTAGSAEDVAQEVCIAVISALPSYRSTRLSFMAFVYGIAAHKVTDVFRANARNRTDPVEDFLDRPAAEAWPEQRALGRAMAEQVRDQLERATPQERDRLLRCLGGETSLAKTASTIGSTCPAIKIPYHRAGRRLRTGATPIGNGWRALPTLPAVRDEPPPSAQDWLSEATSALERGNWRYIVYPPDVAVLERPVPAQLITLLQLVASSMQSQTDGDVREAWRLLDTAARMLPRGLTRSSPDDGGRLAVLPPPPRTDADLQLTTWRVTRVVWREQEELADLRRRVTLADTAHDLLIEACVEHLRWVEFDPWTVRVAPAGERVDVEGSRANLYRRAAGLRAFTSPRTKDLSVSAWRDVGGYRCLCGAALQKIGEADRAAGWRNRSPRADNVPLRIARVRAFTSAKQWLADISEPGKPGEETEDP